MKMKEKEAKCIIKDIKIPPPKKKKERGRGDKSG